VRTPEDPSQMIRAGTGPKFRRGLMAPHDSASHTFAEFDHGPLTELGDIFCTCVDCV
jgi:hypothetical protein